MFCSCVEAPLFESLDDFLLGLALVVVVVVVGVGVGGAGAAAALAANKCEAQLFVPDGASSLPSETGSVALVGDAGTAAAAATGATTGEEGGDRGAPLGESTALGSVDCATGDGIIVGVVEGGKGGDFVVTGTGDVGGVGGVGDWTDIWVAVVLVNVGGTGVPDAFCVSK